MYKVGDIVEIHTSPERRKYLFPGCPAENLEGSIVRIKEVFPNASGQFYHLEMIDLQTKDPRKYHKDDLNLNWEDRHLSDIVVIQDNDITDIFQDS